jgi:hypothetical protein
LCPESANGTPKYDFLLIIQRLLKIFYAYAISVVAVVILMVVLITVVAVPAFVHRVKIVVAKLDIELITIFTCHPIYFGNVSVI